MVEESLRYESPAQGLFRTVTRDAELGGVRLPAGARLMVHFGSANRVDETATELTQDIATKHSPSARGSTPASVHRWPGWS